MNLEQPRLIWQTTDTPIVVQASSCSASSSSSSFALYSSKLQLDADPFIVRQEEQQQRQLSVSDIGQHVAAHIATRLLPLFEEDSKATFEVHARQRNADLMRIGLQNTETEWKARILKRKMMVEEAEAEAEEEEEAADATTICPPVLKRQRIRATAQSLPLAAQESPPPPPPPPSLAAQESTPPPAAASTLPTQDPGQHDDVESQRTVLVERLAREFPGQSKFGIDFTEAARALKLHESTLVCWTHRRQRFPSVQQQRKIRAAILSYSNGSLVNPSSSALVDTLGSTEGSGFKQLLAPPPPTTKSPKATAQEQLSVQLGFVLEAIWKDKASEDFRMPVHLATFRDYLRKVKYKPMDLSSMAKSIAWGYYTTKTHFEEHLNRIAYNCRTYNATLLEWQRKADDFERVCEAKMKQVFSIGSSSSSSHSQPTPELLDGGGLESLGLAALYSMQSTAKSVTS